MSDQLTKEAKKPDAFIAQMSKITPILQKNKNAIVGVMIALFVAGVGAISIQSFQESSEKNAQASLYQVEKNYLETKRKFAESSPEGQVKSGNLDQDYGSIVAEFKDVIQTHKGSKASLAAALYLAEVMEEYNQLDAAIELLASVADDSNKNDLLYGLVATRTGVLQARQNNCDLAVATWDKLLNNKKQEHLHATVQLKKGLCFETQNRVEDARKIYEEIVQKWPEQPEGLQAKKFLRLLVSSL